MHVHKGQKVKVITGKDKGKVGVVLKAFPKVQKVLVEGVNVVKKHVKPGKVSKEGGIVKFEKPIHVSNVMLSNPSPAVKVKPDEAKVKAKKESKKK